MYLVREKKIIYKASNSKCTEQKSLLRIKIVLFLYVEHGEINPAHLLSYLIVTVIIDFYN